MSGSSDDKAAAATVAVDPFAAEKVAMNNARRALAVLRDAFNELTAAEVTSGRDRVSPFQRMVEALTQESQLRRTIQRHWTRGPFLVAGYGAAQPGRPLPEEFLWANIPQPVFQHIVSALVNVVHHSRANDSDVQLWDTNLAVSAGTGFGTAVTGTAATALTGATSAGAGSGGSGGSNGSSNTPFISPLSVSCQAALNAAPAVLPALPQLEPIVTSLMHSVARDQRAARDFGFSIRLMAAADVYALPQSIPPDSVYHELAMLSSHPKTNARDYITTRAYNASHLQVIASIADRLRDIHTGQSQTKPPIDPVNAPLIAPRVPFLSALDANCTLRIFSRKIESERYAPPPLFDVWVTANQLFTPAGTYYPGDPKNNDFTLPAWAVTGSHGIGSSSDVVYDGDKNRDFTIYLETFELIRASLLLSGAVDAQVPTAAIANLLLFAGGRGQFQCYEQDYISPFDFRSPDCTDCFGDGVRWLRRLIGSGEALQQLLPPIQLIVIDYLRARVEIDPLTGLLVAYVRVDRY